MMAGSIRSLADLQALIDGRVEESLTLEYKDSRALGTADGQKNEIAKDVSAFANATGGTIIYGVVEEGHIPVSVDGGVDRSPCSKEWLEQVINSKIHPKVQGLIITPIDMERERAIYVVEIPQATVFAPHQAADRKYYKRRNFAAEPMEDYEVRDAMRRGSVGHPIVKYQLLASLQSVGYDCRLAVSITNLSREPVLYSSTTLYIDKRLIPPTYNNHEFRISTNKVMIGGASYQVAQLERNMMVPNHMPLFQEIEFGVLDFKITPIPNIDLCVGYAVACPGFKREAFSQFRVLDDYSIDVFHGGDIWKDHN